MESLVECVLSRMGPGALKRITKWLPSQAVRPGLIVTIDGAEWVILTTASEPKTKQQLQAMGITT